MISTRFIIPVSVVALMLSALPAAAHEVGVDAGTDSHVKISNVQVISGSANLSASTSVKARTDEKKEDGTGDRGSMIDARIKILENLSARVGDMHRLTTGQIAKIQAVLKTQIDALVSLKATVDASASTTAKAAHGYFLAVPQAQISAAANRILAIVGMMENISVKLSARIDAAEDAGTNVTTHKAALADFNAKVADAKVQANAAVALVVNLKADNGDASVRASNMAALKEARTKLVTARQDLAAAYRDAAQIAAGVKGKGTASTTVKTNVHVETGNDN